MNKKIKLSVGLVLSVLMLSGFFVGAKPASAITCDSATFSGFVVTNGNTINTRFEYDSNYNTVASGQGIKTNIQTFTSNSFVYQLVSNLSPETTYYFRFMTSNGNVTQAGAINSITTPACPNNPPPPAQNPTVTLSADQTSLSYNGSTTVRWSSSNATSCSASGGTNGWSGAKNLSGSFFTGSLTSTANFSITCYNSAGISTGDSLSISVSQPSTPPTISLFANGQRNSISIQSGSAASLTWTAQPLNSASLNCNGSGGSGIWPGGKPLTGLAIFYPTATTTYSINCYDSQSGLSANDSVTVNIITPPQLCQDPSATNYGGSLPCQYQQTPLPTVNLTADQTSLSYNGSTTVRWSSSNATSCSASGGSNGWSGAKNLSGTFFTSSLTSDKTFNIICSNSRGSDSSSVTIYVANNPPPQLCQDPSATNYGGSLPCQYQQTPLPTVNLTADQTSLSYNGSTTVRWSSSNATSCSASGGSNGWSGLRNTTGTFFTGQLTSTRTFSIACTNSNSNSAFGSVTVFVNNNNSGSNPTVTISADNRNIDSGDSTTIRWSSSNATYCDASGGTNSWSGTRGTSGSFRTGSLTSDRTYSITCTNNAGNSGTDSVTVRVSNTRNNGNVNVNLRADRTNLSYNESTTIRWDSDDADSCRASGGSNGWSGRRNLNGSFYTGALTSTTTYRMVCENFDDNDSESDSITIYVNNSNNNNNQNQFDNAPTAVTTSAINIGSNSAQLNSLIFNSPSVSSNSWFEWGSTINLGNNTNQRSVGTSASVVNTDTITGLVAGRTYYYRAAAENPYGRSYGATLSFTTPQTTFIPPTPTTVVRNTTTVINNGGTSQPLVTLTMNGGIDTIGPNERRTYQVEWENISSQTLRKVVLRIILPQTMVFESTNKGSFSSGENTLTLDIDTLSPRENGSLFLTAHTKDFIQTGELIVVVANMVYTNQAGVQEDALAYATHHGVQNGSVLGASAFGSGFLPTSLFGWLFLIILLLILILLSKYLYNQSPNRQHQAPDHPPHP